METGKAPPPPPGTHTQTHTVEEKKGKIRTWSRLSLVVGVQTTQDARRRCLGWGQGACPHPTQEAVSSTSPPPPWGRVPGAGSRATGPPPALYPRARTHFAGAGDRRAVNAQAAHAADGPTGRQADGVAVAAAARPGDEAAALGSGFLPAQPASHSSRDQWAARTGARPGRGLRDPAPRSAGPPPTPLGDRAHRGPLSHAGPPFSALRAGADSVRLGSELTAGRAREGVGEGLAEASPSASRGFAAPN